MEIFNIRFAGEVEKHPELYNNTLTEYSRKDCVAKAWKEIAEEVNLSADECKEKWRNLRNTFVKNLKSKSGGRGAKKKKPYYPTEALQFTVPFIKLTSTSSEKHPSSTPSEVDAIYDLHEETHLSEDTFPEHEDSKPSPTSFPSSLPPQPEAILTGPRGNLTSPETTGTETQGSRRQPKRKERKLQSEADDISDYVSEKSAKIKNTSEYDRREGVQFFLNSLIPDLMQMNDRQLRIYKRKSLLLIDEVLDTCSEDLSCPNLSVRQSQQSTNSRFHH